MNQDSLLYTILAGVGLAISSAAIIIWRYLIGNHRQQIKTLTSQLDTLRQDLQKLKKQLHQIISQKDKQILDLRSKNAILINSLALSQTKISIIENILQKRSLTKEDLSMFADSADSKFILDSVKKRVLK